MLTVVPAASTTFGSLFGMGEARRLGRERVVVEAAESCHETLNHTLGSEWMGCVVDGLREKAANWKDEGKAFPMTGIEDDELQRLSPGGRSGQSTDELMNMLRNFSCEVADGGSQPLRSFTWTYMPKDPCDDPNAAKLLGPSGGNFGYHMGFLPAGNDLYSKQLTEEEAKEVCLADDKCAAFTFSAEKGFIPEDRGRQKQNMLFKSAAEGQTPADGWHAWHKRHLLDCSEESKAGRSWAKPQDLTVHVLRESPPVYIVDDFATEEECQYASLRRCRLSYTPPRRRAVLICSYATAVARTVPLAPDSGLAALTRGCVRLSARRHMLDYTLPRMGPSVVGGGGTSNWRRSYSVGTRGPHSAHAPEASTVLTAARAPTVLQVNMIPDFEWEECAGSPHPPSPSPTHP